MFYLYRNPQGHYFCDISLFEASQITVLWSCYAFAKADYYYTPI
ncbi:hypothetical protein [Dokdonia sp. Asnod1-B02]